MSVNFEELDYQQTPMGELVLRRRKDLVLQKDVYEVKLNDEWLMSSFFTRAEEELARICISELQEENLDVLVGGLGLGYTAHAALEFDSVHSVAVIEVLAEVIGWHQQGLVPLGEALNTDTRCHFIHDSFFRYISEGKADAAPTLPAQRFHAILLDIDHSPCQFLNAAHASFYEQAELIKLKQHLHANGIFGMWSNDPPDEQFVELLEKVFNKVEATIIRFPNPYQDKEATATIYVAR